MYIKIEWYKNLRIKMKLKTFSQGWNQDNYKLYF